MATKINKRGGAGGRQTLVRAPLSIISSASLNLAWDNAPAGVLPIGKLRDGDAGCCVCPMPVAPVAEHVYSLGR